MQEWIAGIANHSTAAALGILAVLIWQLIKDVREIKKGVVWQDEFAQFEKRFTALEERVNAKFNGGD